MTGNVFDFSALRPSQAKLKSANAIAVCRYMKKNLPNKFDLSTEERQDYLNWGLGILYNAEQTNTDAIKQGTAYWSDYGKSTLDRLLAWKVPTDRGINVAASADTQVSTANMSKAINNLEAFAAAVHPYGMIAYAQTQVIDKLVAEGISPAGAKHWLPSAIGWSGYANTDAGWNEYLSYPHAGLVQRFGGSPLAGADLNTPVDIANMGFDGLAPKPISGDDVMQIFSIDPTTIGKSNLAPSAIFTNEQGIHWIADGASLKNIMADPAVPDTYIQITFLELKHRLYEKYGPGGWCLLPTGTDLGLGVGIDNGDTSSWVQVPGPIPASAGTIQLSPTTIPVTGTMLIGGPTKSGGGSSARNP